jgi:hypothetical protein
VLNNFVCSVNRKPSQEENEANYGVMTILGSINKLFYCQVCCCYLLNLGDEAAAVLLVDLCGWLEANMHAVTSVDEAGQLPAPSHQLVLTSFLHNFRHN